MRIGKIAFNNFYYKRLLPDKGHGRHCNCGNRSSWKSKRDTKWRESKLPFKKDDIVYWFPVKKLSSQLHYICRIGSVVEYRGRIDKKPKAQYELENLEAAHSAFFFYGSQVAYTDDPDSLSLVPEEEAALYLLGK